MALNVSMIYQRTDRGVREVYEKSHQFTQSERLILILLDGRLNVAGLKTRLPSLNDERIERALSKLQDAGLVEPMGAMDGVAMGGPARPTVASNQRPSPSFLSRAIWTRSRSSATPMSPSPASWCAHAWSRPPHSSRVKQQPRRERRQPSARPPGITAALK